MKPNLNDPLKNQTWVEESRCDGEDTIFYLYLGDGSRISVLDRLTGFGNGIRDIETGYRDKKNKFWLASGDFDIRREAPQGATIAEAIELIKKSANTCIGI